MTTIELLALLNEATQEIEKLKRENVKLTAALAHSQAMTARHSKQWPLPKAERFARLVAEGKTAPQIAKRMNLTLNQVHSKARNMRLDLTPAKSHREWTITEEKALMAFVASGGHPRQHGNGRTPAANQVKYYSILHRNY